MTEKQDGGMSHQDAIATLTQDVEAWNSYRRETPDWHRPDLSGMRLTSTDLSGADLSEANLSGAHLDDANLTHADLSFADLDGADFTGADLSGADLSNTYLSGARLISADLSGADLRDANLNGANLYNANLEDADLRHCGGLRLDGQFIRNAKFSAFQREPYCIIRRTYTGPKQILILLALVVFVLPFLSKAFFWLSVNQAETVVRDIGTRLDSYVSEHIQTGSEAAEALQAIGQVLKDSGPTLSIHAKEYRVWHILLGLDEHWWLVTLTSLVILYSSVRAVVTIRVGQIREHQKDSGYAPEWAEYRIYYRLHRYFLTPVFWVAMLSAAVTAWNILSTTVWLPALTTPPFPASP